MKFKLKNVFGSSIGILLTILECQNDSARIQSKNFGAYTDRPPKTRKIDEIR